jgi:hypothetical protein
MNILISKILEGGIDLETMQELPKSLLLSCGHKHATLPISDEQLAVILSLLGAGANDAVYEAHEASAPEPPKMRVAPPQDNGVQFAPAPESSDEYTDRETGVASF